MVQQLPAFGPTIWSELAAAGIPANVVDNLIRFDVANPDGSVLYPAGTVLFAPGATADQRGAVANVVAAHDPTRQMPVARRATLAGLFDPLSPAQRASITVDHKDRLQADAAAAPDGTVFVGSSKVKRAADDLGMTPDAWFKLAGF